MQFKCLYIIHHWPILGKRNFNSFFMNIFGMEYVEHLHSFLKLLLLKTHCLFFLAIQFFFWHFVECINCDKLTLLLQITSDIKMRFFFLQEFAVLCVGSKSTNFMIPYDWHRRTRNMVVVKKNGMCSSCFTRDL